MCSIVQALVSLAGSARALEEPRLPAEPSVMRESAEGTTVADGELAEGGPPSVHVSLAYGLELEGATIGRGRDGNSDAARVRRATSRLEPRVEVGLLENLAIDFRVGVVLSESGEVTSVAGTPELLSGQGETLVRVPFRSPDRSGLERLGAGVAWAPFDSSRDPGVPTWIVRAEAELSPAPLRSSCNGRPLGGEVACADPGDLDRDGVIESSEERRRGTVDSGVGRGTMRFGLASTLARRLTVTTPFLAIRGQAELPIDDAWSQGIAAESERALPLRADARVGVVLVPWENRERFARLSIELHARGELVSRGRDVSELFDALGSSASAALRVPRVTGGERAYFDGVGVVDDHAAWGGGSRLVWQASRLVKLEAFGTIEARTAHRLFAERPCGDASVCDAPTNVAYRAALDGDAALWIRDALRGRVGAAGTVSF